MADHNKPSDQDPRTDGDAVSEHQSGTPVDERGHPLRALSGASRDLRKYTHQIWLAGLGAFARAEEEGSGFFDALVEAGREVERRAKDKAPRVGELISGIFSAPSIFYTRYRAARNLLRRALLLFFSWSFSVEDLEPRATFFAACLYTGKPRVRVYRLEGFWDSPGRARRALSSCARQRFQPNTIFFFAFAPLVGVLCFWRLFLLGTLSAAPPAGYYFCGFFLRVVYSLGAAGVPQTAARLTTNRKPQKRGQRLSRCARRAPFPARVAFFCWPLVA